MTFQEKPERKIVKGSTLNVDYEELICQKCCVHQLESAWELPGLDLSPSHRLPVIFGSEAKGDGRPKDLLRPAPEQPDGRGSEVGRVGEVSPPPPRPACWTDSTISA